MEQLNWIRTKDDTKIAAITYLPKLQRSQQVLVIAPSALVSQQAYEPFARYMADQGMTVVSFDYRGVGLSREGKLNHYSANLYQWALLDLDALLLHVKNNFSNQEILCLCHGVSGQIVGLAPASQFIDRLILVNSALSTWRLWPVRYELKIKYLKFFRPILSPLFGYFPGEKLRFLQNLPTGVVKEWFSWAKKHNGVFDVFPDNNYRKLQIPLLALSTSDDWLAPKAAVKELLTYFSKADIHWHQFKPTDLRIPRLRHMGIFHASMQSRIWSFLADWILSMHLAKQGEVQKWVDRMIKN